MEIRQCDLHVFEAGLFSETQLESTGFTWGSWDRQLCPLLNKKDPLLCGPSPAMAHQGQFVTTGTGANKKHLFPTLNKWTLPYVYTSMWLYVVSFQFPIKGLPQPLGGWRSYLRQGLWSQWIRIPSPLTGLIMHTFGVKPNLSNHYQPNTRIISK
jgi:hypothetical protein